MESARLRRRRGQARDTELLDCSCPLVLTRTRNTRWSKLVLIALLVLSALLPRQVEAALRLRGPGAWRSLQQDFEIVDNPVYLKYGDLLCSNFEEDPNTEPAFVRAGDAETALVTGIDADYTDPYVDTATGKFYPRGIYNMGLFDGGSFVLGGGNVGTRHELVVRAAGGVKLGASAQVPMTAANLTRRQAGPFAMSRLGSLMKAIVCCSRDNFVESIRLVRELVGDTIIGNPTCYGYPVEVPRPSDAPLWAGLAVGMGRPVGSTEYVVSSIRFVWASNDPIPSSPPPPSPSPPPPRPRNNATGAVRAPSTPPPPPPSPKPPSPKPPTPGSSRSPSPPPPSPSLFDKLPAGTNKDWYAITKGVTGIELLDYTGVVQMVGPTFPVVTTPNLDTVIAAGRYSKGTLFGLGSENMAMYCCKAAVGEKLPGLDQLILQGAAWAGYYGIKCGGARIRVSHAKYVPFATWLITHRPDLFLKDVEIYTPAADFVRAVKGTVPQGKRPPMDLYVVGPGDGDQAGGNSTYTPTFLAALRDYLNSGKGVIFLGKNPLESVANGGNPGGGSTTTGGSSTSGKARKNGKGGKGGVVTVDVGRHHRRSHLLLRRRQRALLDANTAAYSVNAVSGPTGLVFAGQILPPVPPGVIPIGPLPPSDLLNAEQAAGQYLLYLQGQAGKSYDLSVVVGVVSKARAAMPRGSPGSENLYTLIDSITKLGGSIPVYSASSASNPSSPPPPSVRASPSPSPTPSPAASSRGNATSNSTNAGNSTSAGNSTTPAYKYLGCYLDNANARALPFRLSMSDRALSSARCAGLAAASSLKYFGMQGANCFGGNNATLALGYGTATNAAECNVQCSGNKTETCGFVTASKLLLSLYKLT